MALGAGNPVYVIVNSEGSEALRAIYGERAIRIFLYVDKTSVRERLETKGMPFEMIDTYLSHYSEEVTYRKYCEHVIENKSLDDTVERIRAIVSEYVPSAKK